MQQTELSKQYETLIRTRFPNAAVFDGFRGHKDTTVLDVFFLTPDEFRTFDDFVFETVQPKAESAGLEWALLVPHDFDSTVQYYPDVAGTFSPALARKRLSLD